MKHRKPRPRGLSAQVLRTATTTALLAHLQRLTAADFPAGYHRRDREARIVRDELARRHRADLDARPGTACPGPHRSIPNPSAWLLPSTPNHRAQRTRHRCRTPIRDRSRHGVT